MKLRVGKSYRTRDGHKATITCIPSHEHSEWAYGIVKLDGLMQEKSWLVEGGFWLENHLVAPLDLIAEWDAPAEPAKEKPMIDRVEVWVEPKKSENVLRLRLIESEGRVFVVAVDAHGTELPGSRLFRIDSDGVYECKNVNPAIGLPLDGAGRVKVIQ